MPPEITKIFEWLGLGTPLVYAGATYAVFYWLDTQASAQAKAAIAGWLKPLNYDRPAVARAILEMFDSIYTRPLLSIRALTRSALISLALTFAFILEQRVYRWTTAEYSFQDLLYDLVPAIVGNVLSDYLSLFLIRWSLTLKLRSAFVTLLLATLIGVSFILLFFIFRYSASMILRDAQDQTASLALVLRDLDRSFHIAGIIFTELFYEPFMWGVFSGELLIPALAVHLWLPLVVLAAIAIRSTKYIVGAVSFAQWFLDKGDEHPLRAVGYVAAGLVFVGTTAISLGIYVAS